MIEKVWFRNLTVLKQVDLDLARFTVLVGPNASGKTSVLRGINLLGRCTNEQTEFDEVFSERDSLEDLVTRGERALELGLSGTWGPPQERVQGHLRVVASRTPEGWEHDWQGAWGTRETEANRAGPIAVGLPALASTLSATRVLRLDPRALARPSYDDRVPPEMNEDGAGLPSVLAELAVTAPDQLASIQDALHEIVPVVSRLRFRRTQVTRKERIFRTLTVPQKKGPPVTAEEATDTFREVQAWGHELLVDTRSGQQLPLHLISEGTLLVLGLLTAVLGTSQPNVLLLDDLDRGLHPMAQKNLIALLRRLLEKCPALQIVATSHSPYLLDSFEFDEVRLVTPADDGTTLIGKLVEHPEFARWQRLMAPGELWTMVGEDWLRGTADRKEPHGG